MNVYPTEASTVSQLTWKSFCYYGKVFKVLLPFILLVWVVTVMGSYVIGLFTLKMLILLSLFLFFLLEVYLFSAMLVAAHAVLRDTPMTLKAVCQSVYNRLSFIYAGFFAVVLALCLFYFLGQLLTHVAMLLLTHKVAARVLIFLLLVALPLTFGMVLTFFALPLLALDVTGVWAAFQQSARLVGFRYWLRSFVPYAALGVLAILLMPTTRHGHWLALHRLTVVFDVVVLVGFLPLIINFIVLLLNDLRLRRAAE